MTSPDIEEFANILKKYGGPGPPRDECFQPTKAEVQSKGKLVIEFYCTNPICIHFERLTESMDFGELLND